MERLTKVMSCPNGTKIYDISNKLFGLNISRADKTRMILEKLADYEDLEERLNKVYGDCDGLLLRVVEMLEKHPCIDMANNTLKSRLLTDEEVDKWEEYKQLEEQGILVKLPCRVGDTVWDNDYGRPCAYTITAFSFGECEEYICEPVTKKETVFYYANSSGSITGSFAESEIGKSVFLNKSEAEAKLEELRGNQNEV